RRQRLRLSRRGIDVRLRQFHTPVAVFVWRWAGLLLARIIYPLIRLIVAVLGGLRVVVYASSGVRRSTSGVFVLAGTRLNASARRKISIRFRRRRRSVRRYVLFSRSRRSLRGLNGLAVRINCERRRVVIRRRLR